jgi:serine/threonine protein kinase
LAPEIIQFARTSGYDRMVDYWSLGIVLFEMASLKLPFEGSNYQQIYQKIVEEKVKFPAYFDAELCDVLDGLLAKKPAERLSCELGLQKHPFFSGLDWAKLEEKAILPPPQEKVTAVFWKFGGV